MACSWLKLRRLSLWAFLPLFLFSSHTNRTEIVSVRCPYDKPFSSCSEILWSFPGRALRSSGEGISCKHFQVSFKSGTLLYIDLFSTSVKSSDWEWRGPAKCTTNGDNVGVLSLRRTTPCRVEDGHFVHALKTVCILILVPYSVHDYFNIESVILLSRRGKTRNQGGGISRKIRTSEKKKKQNKNWSAPAVSNQHFTVP